MNLLAAGRKDQETPVDSFSYLRDGWFVCGCLLYLLNRWGIQPETGFLRNYFADILLMPCALPVLLQIQYWLGLRPGNSWPGCMEILLYLVFWSALFEWIGPALATRATGDRWDVAAYAAGAALCAFRWQRLPLLK